MAELQFDSTFPTTANAGETLSAGFDTSAINFTFSTASGTAQVANTNFIMAGTDPNFGGLSVTGVGTLALTNGNQFDGLQLNFTSGKGGDGISGSLSALAFTTGGRTIALSAGNGWSTTSKVTSVQFTISSSGSFVLDSLTTNQIVCFLEGTAIATPEGACPVETLKAGDTILTAAGQETEVRWVGALPVDTRLSLPRAVNPIRIRAGALAEGMPARDLYVSPDHALLIGGVLIDAGALVNGSTISQVARMSIDGFTYYHIDTGTHQALLAEGTPAETFVDYASRALFDGAGEYGPRTVKEMDLPRISASRLVPGHVWAAITARACLLMPEAA